MMRRGASPGARPAYRRSFMTTKGELHELVDQFDEGDAELLMPILQDLAADRRVDRLLVTLLTAPIDDEPETEEEHTLVEEAWQDLAAGRVVSDEEVRREFGR